MKLFPLIILCFCLLFPHAALAKKPMNVAFVVPTAEGDMFWDLLVAYMRSSAADLDINLQVVYNSSRNRFGEKELVRALLDSGEKPDYLVSQIKRNSFPSLLSMTRDNQVLHFTINTAVAPQDLPEVGRPREKHAHWLGQMIPNDFQAGYQLATLLIREARDRGLVGADDFLPMFAISGGRDSSAALERNRGLSQAILDSRNVAMKQLVFSEWEPAIAASLSKRLLERYPDTRVVWSASDGIALGVTEAVAASGKVPGKDVLTGGIDWSAEGLEAVANGVIFTSLGGHFLEGAWAMVLLHDYHHGMDFIADTGSTLLTQFHAITRDNLEKYRALVSRKAIDRMDFRKFSKVHNPALKRYDFGVKALLSEL